MPPSHSPSTSLPASSPSASPPAEGRLGGRSPPADAGAIGTTDCPTRHACRHLTTLAEFEDVRRSDEGFIVIRDAARLQPNRVHRPRCHWVHPGYFRETVVDHGGRHGDYHACPDYAVALALAQSGPWSPLEAGPCQDCNPDG